MPRAEQSPISVGRVALILAVGLLVMLGVVMLRTETVRVHYEMSVLDQQAVDLWQQLRARELELARLRNPMLIRARVGGDLQVDRGFTAGTEPGRYRSPADGEPAEPMP
jgi:hypothetical protein